MGKSTTDAAESHNFNLIIVRDSNSEILVSGESGGFVLPQISIPTHQRVAQCITEGVLDAWNLRTHCLFQPEPLEGSRLGENQFMVLEPRDPGGQPPAQLRWISRNRLCTALDSTRESEVVEETLRRADAHNDGTLPGPFARAGWIDELISWAQECSDSLGLRLTGECRQLNCGPFFSLIRLATDGPALWFKAVGEPNLHEYSTTLGLAQDHPGYLPQIIGKRPEWNGWLMLEAERERVDARSELERWQEVAETFARLQIECLGQSQKLLEIGCKDRRIATIIQQINPFFETMDRLMQEQPSEPPPRLTRIELLALCRHARDVCERLQCCGISDSLLHGDFNFGNVRINADSCVFLDWAEGYLGPPFLSLEYLIAHLHRTNPRAVEYERQLRCAYSRCWAAIASEEQISQAMTLTPFIAVVWYALGFEAWKNPRLLQESSIARYFRSLTRRMHREFDKLRSEELVLDA